MLTNSNAQDKYWVFLSDKECLNFDPYCYFDIKTIERRIKSNIPIFDFTDLPVNNNYINQIDSLVDSISFISRWFNAISVSISTPEQIQNIQNLNFVNAIVPIYLKNCELTEYRNIKNDNEISYDDLFLARKQTNVMEGELFEKNHLNGQGIRIAIFDGGFPGVESSPAFEHIRKENRIIATKDFSRNRKDVYYGVNHGTMVMACIGGIFDSLKLGLATGSEFLLAKTEVLREPFSEEENWLAAAEWADKNGADIINSSLGYTYHRYFPHEMDGKTSLVARAANMAASKGILVVNAFGNDGDKDWHIVGTPADADSVLSIGGIDPNLDYHINFSSFGPTSDKRFKPNVSAYGKVKTVKQDKLKTAFGTSFASPLVAGFAACAWQSNPELTNMELFREIEKSGHLYPYFDYAHGYGIPQASYFTGMKKTNLDSTFTISIDSSWLKILIKDDYDNTNNILFYHIENQKGILSRYYVVKVEQNELKFELENFKPGEIIRIHYNGYTGTYKF